MRGRPPFPPHSVRTTRTRGCNIPVADLAKLDHELFIECGGPAPHSISTSWNKRRLKSNAAGELKLALLGGRLRELWS
jgi:hypothetical protein